MFYIQLVFTWYLYVLLTNRVLETTTDFDGASISALRVIDSYLIRVIV